MKLVVRWLSGVVLASGAVMFAASCEGNRPKTAETAPTGTATAIESPGTQRGQEAYLAYCAMCHGESGEGDGPLAAELQRLSGTRPAHLNDRARLAEIGRDEIVRVITRGGAHTKRSNLMPPWGEKLDATLIR